MERGGLEGEEVPDKKELYLGFAINKKVIKVIWIALDQLGDWLVGAITFCRYFNELPYHQIILTKKYTEFKWRENCQ